MRPEPFVDGDMHLCSMSCSAWETRDNDEDGYYCKILEAPIRGPLCVPAHRALSQKVSHMEDLIKAIQRYQASQKVPITDWDELGDSQEKLLGIACTFPTQEWELD